MSCFALEYLVCAGDADKCQVMSVSVMEGIYETYMDMCKLTSSMLCVLALTNLRVDTDIISSWI